MNHKLKRQNIRKIIILISFLLFPITLYYFSPYIIIDGISKGILTGSFFIFITLLIGSIFFGRIFCGWICPAGGLQEICSIANNNRNKGKWRKHVKYIIWIPWIISIIAMAIYSGGITKIDFFFQTDNGISVSRPSGYIIYYAVIFLIVILSLFGGRRSFCHSACWMAPFMQIGISIRKLLKLPGLKLNTEPDKCIKCNQCTNKCIMSLDVMELVKTGKIIDLDCSLCGECVDICPKDVIKYSIK